MHIERPHRLGQQEAMQRIDNAANDLMQRPVPGGVSVKNVTKNWTGNSMAFSVDAKKGFFGVTVSGVVQVNDETVAIDADLPGIVTTFVPESTIRDAVGHQVDSLLA